MSDDIVSRLPGRFVVYGHPGDNGWYVFDRKWSERVDLEYLDSELAQCVADKMNERIAEGKEPDER